MARKRGLGESEILKIPRILKILILTEARARCTPRGAWFANVLDSRLRGNDGVGGLARVICWRRDAG